MTTTLGQRIRETRILRNMTQTELAKLIKVSSPVVIGNWESDANKPDAEKIRRLCAALQVSAAYLLDFHDFSDFPDGVFVNNEEDLLFLNKLHQLDTRSKIETNAVMDALIQLRMFDQEKIEKENKNSAT